MQLYNFYIEGEQKLARLKTDIGAWPIVILPISDDFKNPLAQALNLALTVLGMAFSKMQLLRLMRREM